MSQSRYAERENAMIVVYIHLLREQSIKEILHDNKFVSELGDFIPAFNLKEELLEAVLTVAQRKEIYADAMDHSLDKWRFDRLGYIEQAILLLACAELEMGKQNPVIVVNEAVRLAKEYCEYDSYKLVNGVLDQL